MDYASSHITLTHADLPITVRGWVHGVCVQSTASNMHLPSACASPPWGWHREVATVHPRCALLSSRMRARSLSSLSTHTIHRSARLVAEAPRLVRVRVRMINLLTMINRPTLTLTLTLTLTPTSVRLMPL